MGLFSMLKKNVLWLNEMSTLRYLIFFDLPLDVDHPEWI